MSSIKFPIKLAVSLVALMTILAGSVYAAGGHWGGGMFNRLDANSDDAITRDEIDPMATTRFERFDGDGDGLVTTDEIDAHLMARVERRRQRILERFDDNADGTITRVEFDALVTQMFERADSDDDGAVSRNEARAYRTLMRGEHRQHHGNHGGSDN